MDHTAFRVVPMQVARNPVARAVAMTRMRQAVLDFQLRLHFLPYDQDVMGDVHAAMQVLTVCLFSLEELGTLDQPAANVMRGAQSALLRCAERKGKWRPVDASAIDIGLQYAVDTFKVLPADVTARAWQRMPRIEQEVGLYSPEAQS